MMEACKTLVLDEDDDAAQLLASIGVSAETLTQAARDGEFARDNCSEYHPPSFPGSASWADTLRSLAVSLKPQGWVREERNGLSVVVSPCGKYAIAVQLGDSATGNRHLMPATKYPKGVGTMDIVRANRNLLLPGMEEHLGLPKVRPIPASGCQTWFFMRRRPYVKRASTSDPTREIRWYAEHVCLEFSLPIMSEIVLLSDDDEVEDNTELRAKAKVTEWSARIVLGQVPLSPDPLRDSKPGPIAPSDSGDGKIDIQITRK